MIVISKQKRINVWIGCRYKVIDILRGWVLPVLITIKQKRVNEWQPQSHVEFNHKLDQEILNENIPSKSDF